MTVERAGAADLAMAALSARGAVPEQLGVVLRLAPGTRVDPAALRRVAADRLGAVPRLRQRLVRVPLVAGRPLWVDDPAFDPIAHVDRLVCAAPGDERALLDLAAVLAREPLDRTRPLWCAAVVTGLAGGGAALVAVLDHVVADGIGGLAVLGRLVDPQPAPAPVPLRPRPAYRVLVAEATRAKLAALGRVAAAWPAARASLRAGGGLRPPRAAACSLVAVTGDDRRFAVARADLAALHATAAAVGATVNDAVLVAVTAALRDLLAARGESVPAFRVAVVVAGRRSADPAALGNATAPVVVTVPAEGPEPDRLCRIAGVVRRLRADAAGPSALALAGPLFRLLAGLGLYRAWLRRQRRFHTLVSNVPGPPGPVAVGGLPVTGMVPFAVGDGGDVTSSFVCLSYAGTLVVTAVVDPGRVPDLPALTAALQAALDGLCAAATVPAAHT
ncbi:wax ester/triacylglycerol synthase domain-containing protein [Blastococcus sp. SYSU D00669]